jgi:dephospho-CoA kinase
MAHSVYAPGSKAVHDVVKEFGTDILLSTNDKDTTTTTTTMEIDRKKLGAIVFADRSAMAKLEKIVWPHVKELIIERIYSIRQEWLAGGDGDQSKRPIVVLEAAVLLDAGWDDLFDGVWVVTAPRDVAVQRLIESRGLSKEEADKRIDAQQSRRGIATLQEEIDKGIVTGVIENKGGLDELTLSLTNALNGSNFWKTP